MTKGWFVVLLACAGAAYADTWQVGDLTTYNQGSWGGCVANCDPSFPDPGAVLLDASFNSVYAGIGGVIVGSASQFTMVFTDATSVRTYMPSIGPFAPLQGSVVDPASTVSGAFGGEVLALEFNVDFSDAGLLPGSSGLRFGDLVLENFTAGPFVNQESFNGLTVRQFLADENILLSGGSTVFSIADLGTAASDLNGSFSNGTPSAFAQAHLVAPTSASTVPEPASWLLLIPAVFGLGWIRRPRPR
ncbi:MAG TPA: hypothetical protein VGF16_05470 [Bryobacteraceae bacterium]|jgi:hypothetical protein